MATDVSLVQKTNRLGAEEKGQNQSRYLNSRRSNQEFCVTEEPNVGCICEAVMNTIEKFNDMYDMEECCRYVAKPK
jgi:hypothetical protein